MTKAGPGACVDELALAYTWEVIEHVLLGWYRDAIAGGGAKAPIFQCFEYLAVDFWGEALKHYFLNDISFVVDRDFNHDIALKASQFVRRDDRIGRYDGQSGANFFAGQGAFQNRT